MKSENFRNISSLLLGWTAFVAWCLLAPRHLPLIALVLITPWVSLAFLQLLAGMIHEAAHGNLVQGRPRFNEFFGNWFASYVFLYGLSSYRTAHFEHHRTELFMIPEDLETAEYIEQKAGLAGMVRDLSGVTAFKMFLFRTGAGSKEKNPGPVTPWSRRITYALTLWGSLAFFGSPITVILFMATLFTLYPLSNRVRLWGTHGDINRADGLSRSTVARNLFSPPWERVFVGNRMLMYHYEHHRSPSLTFRRCEQLARERKMREPAEDNIWAPSYWFCVRKLFLR